MNNLSTPFVSVIIPVFNQLECLQYCLKALDDQTYPKEYYEIVVVDNDSDDSNVFKEVVECFTQASLAHEGLTGSYAARNKGIALANGEIIAFTDADCIPAADWIEKGVNQLLSVSNCGLVAGKIEIFFKDPARLTAVELFESVMAFPQKEFIEKDHYGATANVFTFKEVIDTVGGFDATLKSTGDGEWGRRVYNHGYYQVYADDVCVAHPARYSFRQLYQRNVRLAGGVYDSKICKCASSWERNTLFLKVFLKNLKPPLRFAYNISRNPRFKRLDDKLKLTFVMFFVRYVRACELLRLKFGGVSSRG